MLLPRRLISVAFAFLPGLAFAQKLDPVQWTLAVEPPAAAPGARVLLKLSAKIDKGWHLYSTTTAMNPGPVQTKLALAEGAPVELKQLHQPKPNVKRDEAFNNYQETYDDAAVFLMEVDVPANAAAGELQITAQARYQVCSGTQCLRTKTKTAVAALKVNPAMRTIAPVIPAGYIAVQSKPLAAAAPAAAAMPVQLGATATGQNEDLSRFLLVAFGFGLAAIFTPCVFPMIPFVMSDFLHRSNAVFHALLFCIGIIVTFTTMGVAATAVLGPFGVQQIGSNPWVNAFIFAIFIAFGLSMLGAFEITLPSGLVNKANDASQGGGALRTLLMGLTFSLTSFACVGPFMGTLLAAAVQGGGARPAIGMAAFSSGLAAPFFVLALFPSFLKKLPKSGGWLPRVKTVMGFMVLAAAIKYLANIDQVMQWEVVTRERFLAAWIVLLALPGLYLLGFLNLEGVKPGEHLGIGRLLTAGVFLIAAVSLWPGMSCHRLGELEAYIPACAESNVSAGGASAAAAGPKWIKNDYRGAVAKAKAEGKLLLVNFTGYACTNCHWMKANMFPRTEVAEALKNFVAVELYTDGTDAASEENQKLQEGKFNTVAIPHYVIVDGDEKIVASFAGLTKDSRQFVQFLAAGKPATATTTTTAAGL
ncbi:MAG: redoxin [Acidobacteria bacterium]|nr:redoxin [Acidobacteriota bacterium]